MSKYEPARRSARQVEEGHLGASATTGASAWLTLPNVLWGLVCVAMFAVVVYFVMNMSTGGLALGGRRKVPTGLNLAHVSDTTSPGTARKAAKTHGEKIVGGEAKEPGGTTGEEPERVEVPLDQTTQATEQNIVEKPAIVPATATDEPIKPIMVGDKQKTEHPAQEPLTPPATPGLKSIEPPPKPEGQKPTAEPGVPEPSTVVRLEEKGTETEAPKQSTEIEKDQLSQAQGGEGVKPGDAKEQKETEKSVEPDQSKQGQVPQAVDEKSENWTYAGVAYKAAARSLNWLNPWAYPKEDQVPK